VAALASLVITAAALAQKEPTFHVDVPLVNVFVSVTDKAGAPIGGLTRDDFQLFEDGKLQKIAVFERDTSAPLAIVLSVDLSGSVYKDFAAEQRAAQRFAKDVLRTQDRADVVAFADGTREVTGFTGDAKRIAGGLNGLHPGAGGTAFYSSVSLSSQLLRPEHARRVLVVISDGDNTVNDVSYQEALDEAVRDEVMTQAWTPSGRRADRIMSRAHSEDPRERRRPNKSSPRERPLPQAQPGRRQGAERGSMPRSLRRSRRFAARVHRCSPARGHRPDRAGQRRTSACGTRRPDTHSHPFQPR